MRYQCPSCDRVTVEEICSHCGVPTVALSDKEPEPRVEPPEAPVDVVTFSYSLTMIPDWFAAIENALRMLRPGGQIGVVDFYVSRKYPAQPLHLWHAYRRKRKAVD